MKTLVFLASLGGAYAVLGTFLPTTPAALLSWPAAFAVVALYARWRSGRNYERAMKSEDPDEIARAALRLDPEFAFMPDRQLDHYIEQARRPSTPYVPPEPDDPNLLNWKCPRCGDRVNRAMQTCPSCGDNLAEQ